MRSAGFLCLLLPIARSTRCICVLMLAVVRTRIVCTLNMALSLLVNGSKQSVRSYAHLLLATSTAMAHVLRLAPL